MAGNATGIVDILINLVKKGTGATDAAGDLGKLDKAGAGAGDTLKSLTSTLLGQAAGYLSVAGAVAGAVEFIKQSIDAGAEAEAVNARLNATLIATGLDAEISAGQIDAMATSLMGVSSFDDEDIVSAYNALLKFDSIPTGNLDQITRIAMDMSAAMGSDLVGHADALGRALETGVIPRTWGFSAALKEQFAAQVKAGDSAGALALMMGELNQRYGGQAVAQMNTYIGATERLKNAMENYKEAVAGDLSPMAEFKNHMADLIMLEAEHTIALNQTVAAQEELGTVWGGEGAREIGRYVEQTLNQTAALEELVAATEQSTSVTDMFGFSVSNTTQLLQQEQAEFGFILNFSKQYETNIKNIADAEADLKQAEYDLTEARSKWGDASQQVQDAQDKVDGLTAKLSEAEQASRDATNEMIAGFLQAQLTADGSFTDEDIAKVLNYRRMVGLLSDDAYNAALNALHIAQNLAAIPASTSWTVTQRNVIQTVYEQYGFIPSSVSNPSANIGNYTEEFGDRRAAGGPFGGGAIIINEDPTTRPEALVMSGNGQVLTRQDAMAAMGGGQGVTVVYSPMISLGDREEVTTVLLPLVRQALREAG